MTDQTHDKKHSEVTGDGEALPDEPSESQELVSEIPLEQVIDLIPMMVVVYQGDRHLYVSPSALELTGYTPEELLDINVSEVVHPASRGTVAQHLSKPPQEIQDVRFILRLLTKSGEVRWASMATKATNFHGQAAVLAVMTDVTEKQRMSSALRESEARFKSFFDQALIGLAIGENSAEGRIVEANHAYEQMLGYSSGGLDGKSFVELTHPEDVARDLKKHRLLITGEIPYFRIEKRYLHRDGGIVHGRLTVILVRDDITSAPIYTFAIVQDITHEKNASRQVLAEEKLLRQLLQLQDKERRLLACDIHDGLIQDITGAMYMLQSLPAEFESRDLEVPETIELAEKALRNATQEGRRLIDELRPLMIEDLGLLNAIRSLIDKEHASFPVGIDFDARVNTLDLSPNLEGQVYRILQESLNNIRRHSQATRADVRITQPGKFLVIEVRDDGIGFDPENVSPDRSGVAGIKERARLFGGGASFESAPNKGTRITVQIPIAADLQQAIEDAQGVGDEIRIIY